jgi:hypothetical protein
MKKKGGPVAILREGSVAVPIYQLGDGRFQVR